MLQIVVPESENWDEKTQTFHNSKRQVLQLEHSLISLAKWEALWGKAFLSGEARTSDETKSYIQCMTLTQNIDPSIYSFLTPENIQEVNTYISNPMTATKFFNEEKQKMGIVKGDAITSELIYYWMVSLNIPFECQKWHLNRLLTLIKVCNIKNQPAKKRSRAELMRRNSDLNAARRKQMNTSG